RRLDDEGRREGDHVDVRAHQEPVPEGRLADPAADREPVVEAAPRGRVTDELDADEKAGTPDVPDDPERPEVLGEELPEPDAHLLRVLGQPPVEDLADRGDPRRRRYRVAPVGVAVMELDPVLRTSLERGGDLVADEDGGEGGVAARHALAAGQDVRDGVVEVGGEEG